MALQRLPLARERRSGGDVGRLQIRLEAIAGAPYGLDQLVVPGGRECLAQAPDVDIDGGLLDETMPPPDFVEQARPREDPSGVRHEEVQQAQLRRPEVDRLVA